MTWSNFFKFSTALSTPGVGMLYTMLDGSMKLSKPAMWSARPFNSRKHSHMSRKEWKRSLESMAKME